MGYSYVWDTTLMCGILLLSVDTTLVCGTLLLCAGYYSDAWDTPLMYGILRLLKIIMIITTIVQLRTPCGGGD